MYADLDAVTNVITTPPVLASAFSAAASPAIAIARYGATAKPWHANAVATSQEFGA